MDTSVIPIDTTVNDRPIEVDRRVNFLPYPEIDRRSLSTRGFHRNDVYGHRLVTASGKDWLTRPVAFSRLDKEFRYLESDEELGKRHVEQLIGCFELSLRQNFSLECQHRLQRLSRKAAQAIYLQFGDNPGSNTEYLETVLIPNEPLVFGYRSVEHCLAATPLLKRCASVLGYEVVELLVGK